MKQNKNRKIELKFMDMSVKIEGSRSLEGRALALLNTMIESRVKFNELVNNDLEGDQGAREIEKPKELKFEPMFS